MRTETLWLNSPWNNAEEVRQQLNFAEKIQLHDVTLRDGEQQAGLVFSHDDKIAIAERLAEVGIHRIEAGPPFLRRMQRPSQTSSNVISGRRSFPLRAA